MDIKLIACDLDDTLLRPDLTIAPECKKALQEAVRKGVVVTIATGRMFRAAKRYAEELEIKGVPLIIYQGAWVRTLEGKDLYSRPLSAEDALLVLNTIRPYGFHYQTYHEDELYMERITPEGEAYARLSGSPVHIVPDLEMLAHNEPLKFVVINYREKELSIMESELKQKIGDKVSIVRSKPHFLEISHLKATKGYALKAVSDHFGIDRSQVMAIGDSYNDLDMIEWAGLGVAMGNSWAEVKAKADYVTLSNEEEGVAEAIRRFVLQ